MENSINEYEEDLARVTQEKERISAELDLARKIQRDVLPNKFPPYPGRIDFDIFAMMEPAKEVGGDFYDLFMVDETHIALVIADVSGKGVPAALFMMITKDMIQTELSEGASPGEALTAVNSRICKRDHEGMFVTVWAGIFDLETGKLVAANAGHEYPAIKNAGSQYELLHDKHGFVLGGMEGIKYREYELTLEPGSSIFVYTDGVPEATDANEEMYGTDKMLEALNSKPDADVTETIHTVYNGVQNFVKEAEQFDDLTMLCFRYNGNADEQKDEKEKKDMENVLDMTVLAVIENQTLITEKVEAELNKIGCSMKDLAAINIAIDELFSNVAKYAYGGEGKGDATVKMEVGSDPKAVAITFINSGDPFDPTAQKEPDITLPAEKRGIGGLGLLMVRRSMDEMKYEYKDGKNVLRILKILS